jgi:hypothetical protein
MARVKVNIEAGAIVSALNEPGGDVFKWRDDVAEKIKNLTAARSPIGNPENTKNAAFRHGPVGQLKASWRWDRIGSNGDTVRARIFSTCQHSILVEEGRDPVVGRQRFSWTAWNGETRVAFKTGGYRGTFMLRDSVNEVMTAETGGDYAPLVY